MTDISLEEIKNENIDLVSRSPFSFFFYSLTALQTLEIPISVPVSFTMSEINFYSKAVLLIQTTGSCLIDYYLIDY